MLSEKDEDAHKFSISNSEYFWANIVKEVQWSKLYTAVLKDKLFHSPKWFVGGEINMSYNCLDRHVIDGYGDCVAIIHDSPATGSTQSLTFNQLLLSVSFLSGVLVDRCGVKKGDMILLYFPVIPECLISMLACARIGVTYIVVYGGFSAKELANRISYTEPKVILTCNVGADFGELHNYKEKLQTALEINGYSPKYCLIYNRPNFKPAAMRENADLDWTTELYQAKPHGPVPVESDHPLFMIFTSGTTGEPKCLVHLSGNYIATMLYEAKYVFDVKPGDTFWGLSNFGWIFGQSLMSYGALMVRARSILYEGKIVGSPDNVQFTRVLNWHKVTKLIATPTALRILQKFCSKSDLQLNYQGLSQVMCGGEICDTNIRKWVFETFGCNVYQVWGQTELSGAITRSVVSDKIAADTFVDNEYMLQPPGLGLRVVDRDTGVEIPYGQVGRLVLKLPTIPALAGALYKSEQRFSKFYFSRYPGYFDTMDVGMMREDGAFKVLGREDDVIHVGAARICGGAVEDACIQNENLSSAVVVSLDHELLGSVPFAFLVRKENVGKSNKEIINDSIKQVNDIIGDVASFKRAVVVTDTPRTISGKAQRNSLADMLNGRAYKIPSLVANPHVYPVIYDILIEAGYKATLPQ